MFQILFQFLSMMAEYFWNLFLRKRNTKKTFYCTSEPGNQAKRKENRTTSKDLEITWRKQISSVSNKKIRLLLASYFSSEQEKFFYYLCFKTIPFETLPSNFEPVLCIWFYSTIVFPWLFRPMITIIWKQLCKVLGFEV